MNKTRPIFLVLFSLLLLPFGQSQSIGELIRYAEAKYSAGQYQLAAREFQRALFFGPKEMVADLHMRTGDCYFEQGRYIQAESYYRFVSTLQLPDSLKAEALLKKATCQVLEHHYQMALIDLYRVSPAGNPNIEKKKNLLLGISYFGLGNDEQARGFMLRSISPIDTLKQDQVEKLFLDKRLTRPKPELAYWLSVVLPGTGQFYAGDVKNGINSLVLSVGLAILTFRMATLQSVWDALLTIFPWWQRYYIGGYNSAREIARNRLDRNRAEVYREMLHHLRD